MDDLKILQKTETLHEGRWWEPVGGGSGALLFVSPALPDSRWAGGVLFYSGESGRNAL